MKKMSSLFNSLSARERYLTIIVAVVLVVGVAYYTAFRAVTRLDELEDAIDRRQDELLLYQSQANRSASVESAFQLIASQHSSEWTREEINDRLRREIERLSVENPGPPDSVLDFQADMSSRRLVNIASYPQGQLDTAEGYREYKIDFRVQPTDIRSLIVFLERLQESPQALRINELKLSRDPVQRLVTAQVEVIRTVVNSEPGPWDGESEDEDALANIARNGSFEEMDGSGEAFPEWQAEGLAIAQDSRFKTDGAICLQGTSQSADARVWQRQELAAGRTYELSVDVALIGSGRLQVVDEGQDKPYEGAAALLEGGDIYRYVVRFTVPGEPGTAVWVGAPVVAVDTPGSTVYMDAVVLHPLEG